MLAKEISVPIRGIAPSIAVAKAAAGKTISSFGISKVLIFIDFTSIPIMYNCAIGIQANQGISTFLLCASLYYLFTKFNHFLYNHLQCHIFTYRCALYCRIHKSLTPYIIQHIFEKAFCDATFLSSTVQYVVLIHGSLSPHILHLIFIMVTPQKHYNIFIFCG